MTPHLTVIYDEATPTDYARRVAATAEDALEVLRALFEADPPHITLTIDPTTDVFNAVAPPLPRPKVALRALFPLEGEMGFRAEDQLRLLLLHELTHDVQLSYTEGSPLPQVGLVGETVAAVPPSWFLEGIATWVESEFTAGGRRDDARTRGILETIALADDWPTLDGAGLITYGSWPGGDTRYLFGANFIDYLVKRYGFDAIRDTLRRYNAGIFVRPFADAWRQVSGEDLGAAWEAWHQGVLAAARRRVAGLAEGEQVHPITYSGWFTGSPTVSPDGSRLAWVSWPPRLEVADLVAGTLGESRTLLRDTFPRGITWLNDTTLAYARIVREAGHEFSELFTLDLDSGRESRLTRGARAHFPAAAPDGCLLFVRDTVTEGSSLKRLCPATGKEETLWQAPEGEHLIGLSVSRQGRIAVAVWRAGFADLALLIQGRLTFLTRDRAQDLDPAWQGEDALLFSSDRDAVFDLYRLELADGRLSRLTTSSGGAFQPAAVPGGVIYRQLGAAGYDLAWSDDLPGESVTGALAESSPPVRVPVVSAASADAPATFTIRPYSPLASLAPYGWLPAGFGVTLGPLGLALGASLLGQDDSGEHAYALTFAYDGSLTGYLGGVSLDLTYRYRLPSPLTTFQRRFPLGFELRAGVWPHDAHLEPRSETALGLQGSVRLDLPLDRWAAGARLQLGLLNLSAGGGWQFDGRADAALGRQFVDSYGYRTRGPRFGVTGVWSATPTGPSLGAWLDASYFQPLSEFGLTGTAEFAVRSGYRQTPPLPLELAEAAGVATLGYHLSLPAPLRYGDGLYALERITLEPRLRVWFDGDFGVGGDFGVFADTVVLYGAPVSIGGTVGFAQGWWYRLGVGLPF